MLHGKALMYSQVALASICLSTPLLNSPTSSWHNPSTLNLNDDSFLSSPAIKWKFL